MEFYDGFGSDWEVVVDEVYVGDHVSGALGAYDADIYLGVGVGEAHGQQDAVVWL